MAKDHLLSRCPVGNIHSEILVVQTAQNGYRQRAADSLDGTRNRRVLVPREVRTRVVVVFLVTIEQMAKMASAEHLNRQGTRCGSGNGEGLRRDPATLDVRANC